MQSLPQNLSRVSPPSFAPSLRERLAQLGRILCFVSAWQLVGLIPSQAADGTIQVFYNAKVFTADAAGRIADSFAIDDGKFIAVGNPDAVEASARELSKSSGKPITREDLQGRMILPGLSDSHVHAVDASLFEWNHTIPEMRKLEDVFRYIRSRTEVVPPGEWIMLSQIFVTRLEEQRFPTREELDLVAPNHPVFFRTGPDGALNSLALTRSEIGEEFKITDGQPGYLERDPKTGKLNGILRSCTRLVRMNDNKDRIDRELKLDSLAKLLKDYNSVGITSICDRNVSREGLELYNALYQQSRLSCRVFMSFAINAQDSLSKIQEDIRFAAAHPLHRRDSMLWLRGTKIFLDGGMLTGSAYMKEPWGVSAIYGINDPNYRGLLYVQPDKLFAIAKESLSHGLQMTAHSVGDGAIEALLHAYEQVDRETPVRAMRPCITHCNFLTRPAIEKMKQLGVVADLQPAWLWLDGRTLQRQFGEDRLRWFQPYKTLLEENVVVGGGSDHMQKVGSLRSVNPYNPFLGMWIALARIPRGVDKPLHPSESLTRAEVIKLYTINNAYLTFEENEKGSIEPGKRADWIVLDRDILECPLDAIPKTTVLKTYLAGNRIYQAE